ncbi:MAG: DUF4012 domain-containing protein [Patescibacteria group bacterium]
MPAKTAKKKSVVASPQESSHLPSALVAGAAGFLGSHLCEALIAQNCRVYGIDNWTTGKKENLTTLLGNPNFVFIEHDLNLAFKSPPPKVDYIFHLAGIEAYTQELDVSLETLLVNSLGSKELLEIAKKMSAKFLLVSTADLFSGFASQKDLTHYFGSSHEQAESYSQREAKRFSEALTFEYINRYQIDARVVRIGDVYGPRLNLDSGSELAKFFLSLKTDKPLIVSGQGMTPVYPTYVSDIVYGLTKAMFSQSSSGQIFTLINPEKVTSLTLASNIKKALPEKEISVKFSDSDQEAPAAFSLNETILESQKTLGWIPRVSLEEGISATLKWLATGKIIPAEAHQEETSLVEPEPDVYTPEMLGIKPASAVQPESPKERNLIPRPSFKFKFTWPSRPKIKLSRRFKLSLAIFSVVAILILGPLLLLAGSAYSGVQALKKASQTADIGQVSKLQTLTATAQNRFNFSRQILRQSQPVLRFFGLKNMASNLDRLLFIGFKLSQGGEHLIMAGESGQLLTEIIFHQQDGNIPEAIKRIQINLDQAYGELSFVESELQSGQERNLDITASLTQKMQLLTSKLPEVRAKINQVRVILPLIPSLIAQDSKKTYLLLFQNSAEIRPTGGFIGSYGLLTFEKGKLLDLDVQDIYAADGQLQGFIQPPKPIEAFLGKNTWFFRDSNWDPDFTVSAARAEWFLNKTTGRNVDGVIAVNLPAVKLLLQATGPITLADFDQQVTSDNLFEQAEYQSEVNFFPGSTQKKDFLGALSREIFAKAKDSSATDLIKFAQAFESSLAQKHLLVYLHDQPSQRLLLGQNWAGAIFTPNVSPFDNRPVTADFNYVVEANLGINKANYFLTRNIKHQLTILKTKDILVSTTIDYNNQSPADAWPGGVYRSYVRDYFPAGSQLISVKVGEEKLNLSTLDKETVNDKNIIGFPVTVPVKDSLSVEITYRLPQALNLVNSQGRLAIVIPKQPGTLKDGLEVILNYPTYLSVVAVNPQTLVSPQVVNFQSNLETDRVFLVDLRER